MLWQKCVRLSRTMARESDLLTRAAMHESIHHVTKRVLRSMPQHQHVQCTCRTSSLSVETTEMENVKLSIILKMICHSANLFLVLLPTFRTQRHPLVPRAHPVLLWKAARCVRRGGPHSFGFCELNWRQHSLSLRYDIFFSFCF